MRIQEISHILAVILLPPVSSLSFIRNHRPLRSAPRSWGLPALNFSDKCQVTRDNLCVAACLRVVRGCIRLRIPFCLANPLGSYLWKFIGLQNSTNKCVRCFRHSPLSFLDHTGEKPLVLFSEDGLAVLVFTAFLPTGSDVTESMVFFLYFSRRAQTFALAQHI